MTLLLFLVGAAGLYFYLRARSRRRAKIALDVRPARDAEESVPFRREQHEMEDYNDRPNGYQAGKGRDEDEARETVFDIGDEEPDDEPQHQNKHRST